MDFNLIPEATGLYVHEKNPHEKKPRDTIDLIKMEFECQGYTIEQAKAAKGKRKPKNCKHLDEVVFRVRHAGIKLGRFLVREAID